MLKKLVCLALSVVMLANTFATASAAETDSIPDNSTEAIIEITEEYIQKYGIHTVDEYGNEVIEIPLGPSTTNVRSEVPVIDDNNLSVCDECNCYDENTMSRHISTIPHTHEIMNLKKYNYSNIVPATKYAMAGMTIEKKQ